MAGRWPSRSGARSRRRDGRFRIGLVAIRHGADYLPVEGLVTSMRPVPLEGTNLPLDEVVVIPHTHIPPTFNPVTGLRNPQIAAKFGFGVS